MGSEIPLTLKNRFLPASYEPLVQINHTKPNFSGQVSIPIVENSRFSGDMDAPFSVTLHAHKLIVTSATLVLKDGQAIKLKVTYERENQKLVVAADTKYDTVDKILISYVGSITPIKTYKDETFGIFKTNYSDSLEGKSDNFVIATHTQPFGCRMLFPVIDELVHKVPISLTVITKSSFKVISNTQLASVNTIDMSEDSKFTFETTPPIAPSVFGFVIGDFEQCLSDSSLPVNAYVTKGDSSQVRYALSVLTKLLPLFEKTLGCSFPLGKLDLVLLPFFSDTAMENWGMITVIRDVVLLDEHTATKEQKKQVRQLIAHQLTHQWIGNLVSVDEWEYSWLVEAFATFVGNYILSLAAIDASDSETYIQSKVDAMQECMDHDSFADKPVDSLYDSMQKIKGSLSLKSRTNDFVEKSSYEKGMILLNMIAVMFQMEKNESDFTSFFEAMSEVIAKFRFQAIKPFEIWSLLNDKSTYEILTFVHSWVRYSGFPYLKVKCSNGKISIEQNRFFFNDNVNDLQLENHPFNIPLAMKVFSNDGEMKFVNLMLTDRSMELDIPVSQFVSMNFENQFYYKTIYSPEIQKTIIENASGNKIEPAGLIGIIKDYGKIMGQPMPATDSSMFGSNQLVFLMELADALTLKTWNVDFEVLKHLLAYLEIVKSIFLHFTDYVNFKVWIENFAVRLMEKIGNWDVVFQLDCEDYNSVEYEVRNVVLQLACHDQKARQICKKLFKSFVSAGVSQKFLPRELLSSMFNVTMMTASLTEYKQVLALSKNSNVSLLNHTNASAQEVQTSAVSSLGFCQKYELLTKTLHFVNTNIDSKMIELALIGFKYEERSDAKETLWKWYKVNYDQWVKRSLRKGSDWSKQIGIAVGNITNLVLGEVMQYSPKEIDAFVELKCSTLPEHKLQERMANLREESEEKRVIASYYNEIGKICK